MYDLIEKNLQNEDLEVLRRRGFDFEDYISDYYDDHGWDSEDED